MGLQSEMGLQAFEVVVPESLVVGHPISHRAETLRDQAIIMLPSLSLFGHQAGTEQDAKMLGYGRAAHFKVSGDLFDGLVSLDQKIQDPAGLLMALKASGSGSTVVLMGK
jgi:hypothetical protein